MLPALGNSHVCSILMYISRDDGASSSQGTRGTQDMEQDHQGDLVNSNEQPVEPNGQDEANPGGDQEGGEEEALAGGESLDRNLEYAKYCRIMFPPIPPDPREHLIMNMVDALPLHHGHMLAERD